MTNGYLTTHVLNTAKGIPAGNLRIDLYGLNAQTPTLIRSLTTNADGRTDNPILPKDEFALGGYRLDFFAGDYLRGLGDPTPDVLFFDIIPIVFNIDDINAHYHVPLLLSPYGYSTYRGS